VLALIVR